MCLGFRLLTLLYGSSFRPSCLGATHIFCLQAFSSIGQMENNMKTTALIIGYIRELHGKENGSYYLLLMPGPSLLGIARLER